MDKQLTKSNNQSVIAYLGDEYSYSFEAARNLAAGYELRAYDSMAKVIAAVGGECYGAVLPIENNTEGAVGEVYDALAENRLNIVKQSVLPITHSLIVKTGATLDDITQVTSHPQAIGQCRKFLSTLGARVIAAQSTSAALRAVDEHTAAIAFRPRDGQTAIARGIQDSMLNSTRFAFVTAGGRGEGGTVSVLFDAANVPGALAKILNVIYEHGINLTRIISRPTRSGSGEYRFFADFDYTLSNAALDELMVELNGYCTNTVVLGRYDVINLK